MFYKYAKLYMVEEPDPDLNFRNRALSGLGAGLLTYGGMHAVRKGYPMLQEKFIRGVFNKPGYQATGTRKGLDALLKNKAATSVALGGPLLYNMFLRQE
jgi:hypothetical protein